MILLILVIITCAFSFLIVRLVFIVVTITGFSMSPDFFEGDRVLLLRFFPPKYLRRQQFVVCISPLENTRYIIKQVIGLPRDKITRSIVEAATARITTQEWIVPQKYIFLKSHNSNIDSFLFGPIPYNLIVGIVILKLPRHTRPVWREYHSDRTYTVSITIDSNNGDG